MTTNSATAANATLSDRMEFMQLDAKGRERIRQLKTIVDRELPAGLDRFYAQLRATPQVRRFFGDDSHMARAKGAQVGHWAAISSGNFDEHYVAKVRTIGLTHARIGLEPRWYIGGYALVLEHLVKAIVTECWPKGLMQRSAKSADDVASGLASLVKAVMLDMDLAISVYIEAAEEARIKGEAEAQAKERAMVASSIGAGLTRLAEKDLTFRMTDDMPEAYRQLQSDFNAALQQLDQAMQDVSASTESMTSGAHEISTAADDLSRRTEQQASSLEETAAALDQITATVKQTAESAAQAREVVSTAKSDAERSGGIVRQAVEAMGMIDKSSKQISQIIGVIDEIAFQTNLLALNAGVEAARAGEAGRGFAVVASEVRALAQRSAEAAKEIKDLISMSTSQVGQGVELVAQTGEALERIVGEVGEISDVVAAIASGAQEQATAMQQVNTAINDMDKVTQQNAAMAEQATAAGKTLVEESGQLMNLVRQFATAGKVTPMRRPVAADTPGTRAQTARPALKTVGGRRESAIRHADAEDARDGWENF